MASTPNSCPTSASDRPAPWATDPDEPEMTFNEPIWARSAMRPSVIPISEVRAVRTAPRDPEGSTATAVTTRSPG